MCWMRICPDFLEQKNVAIFWAGRTYGDSGDLSLLIFDLLERPRGKTLSSLYSFCWGILPGKTPQISIYSFREAVKTLPGLST